MPPLEPLLPPLALPPLPEELGVDWLGAEEEGEGEPAGLESVLPGLPPLPGALVTGSDSVTGGALEEAGVTGATEEAVNGVVGPESALGKTVDETVNAVGGLLGGNK